MRYVPTWRARAGALVRSPAVVVASRLPVLLSGLLVAPVIARQLGPSDRGLAAAAVAVLAIAPVVLGLGVPMAVRRAAAHGTESESLRAGRRWSMVLVLPSAGIGAALSPLVLPDTGAVEVTVFVLAMATVPAFVQVLNDQSVLVARSDFRGIAALQSAQPLSYALAVVVGWVSGELSLVWVIGAYSASLVVASVIGRALVHVPLRGDRLELSAIVRDGLPYAGSQAAEVATSRADQAVMVLVIGAHGAGLYSVAALLGSLPLVLAQTVGMAAFARLARIDEERRPAARSLVIRVSVLLGVVSGALLAICCPWLVPLLFGPPFAAAVPASIVLTAAAPLVVCAHVGTSVLAAEGRGHAMTVAQVAGLSIGLALLVALGPRAGVVGAAVASVLGFATVTVIVLAYLRVRPAALVRYRRSDLGAVRRILIGPQAEDGLR
ncbi:oligosaccharide flippase family protein [Cellulomonas fimi]|uniref:lipopolysaccharide biosynthesis protein n=1 Tax=Cellulomonas fimi TaxID=1708 RepID=UPI00234DFE89|nr:oligosaccharide flippase family protein [Cellulomonas fimi]MDC7121644.1 oligosaccharide flippase family protein [Cellulomonas fimi]